MKEQAIDVAIIGGGLAGLTAACYLGRAGLSVKVYEKSHAPGGRARTDRKGAFSFNLGPRALYRGGPAERIFHELGVSYTGKRPGTSGGYAIYRGDKHTLPSGVASLLVTGLFGLSAKMEAAKLLNRFGALPTGHIQNMTVQDWLQQNIRHAEVRDLVAALFRVSTYANDPARMSAGAALEECQKALSSGVLYLDGGWQTLVDGLRDAAMRAGVDVLTGDSVDAIIDEGPRHRIRLSDGAEIFSSYVILALAPEEVSRLLSDGGAGIAKDVSRMLHSRIPIRAACLDVALEHLPQPAARFALGIDAPLYFSVHSASATLAPPGGALIHVAKYAGDGKAIQPAETERELEQVLDLIQPGWRSLVVHRRFLPRLTVANALPVAQSGGKRGRPGSALPGRTQLFVAGDWVGPEAQLADAAMLSAKQAADLILQRIYACTA